MHSSFPALLPSLFGEFGIGSIPWADVPKMELRSAVGTPSGPTPSITRNAGLVFTPAEPACNVYTTGGCDFDSNEASVALGLLPRPSTLPTALQAVQAAQRRPVPHCHRGALAGGCVRRWWNRHSRKPSYKGQMCVLRREHTHPDRPPPARPPAQASGPRRTAKRRSRRRAGACLPTISMSTRGVLPTWYLHHPPAQRLSSAAMCDVALSNLALRLR